MKRLIVSQEGYVHVDVTRTFVLEVQEHLDLDGVEWEDESSTSWFGYNTTVENTEVSKAPECSSLEGLPVLHLEDIE